jgi:hypothetical protein
VRLNPILTKLFAVAEKVECSSEIEAEAVPSSDFMLRVLRTSARPSHLSELSLLELMVQRGAAIAGLVGVLALAIQLTIAGPSVGIWNNAFTQGSVVLRIFLP